MRVRFLPGFKDCVICVRRSTNFAPKAPPSKASRSTICSNYSTAPTRRDSDWGVKRTAISTSLSTPPASRDFSPLRGDLSGKLRANGELLDDASPQLYRIRRQIEQQRNLIQKTLEEFVQHHYEEGVLQEDYVTIRNGRLVVPVKATWKRRVEGVIHGSSSTGQTAFIEPVASIELNNRIVELLEEEQREILRILREMTDRLRMERREISAALHSIADLEIIFAKARFGIEFRCVAATFSPEDASRLKLKQARHPLLEDVLRREGRKILPFSLTLEKERRVLLVSGPNAGGKTVILKTIGLLSLMSQAGIPVPAEEAELPWFHHVPGGHRRFTVDHREFEHILRAC